MLYHSSFAASAVTLLLFGSVEAGLYGKNSAVLQVDGKSYNRLITKSNHTSVSFTVLISGNC